MSTPRKLLSDIEFVGDFQARTYVDKLCEDHLYKYSETTRFDLTTEELTNHLAQCAADIKRFIKRLDKNTENLTAEVEQIEVDFRAGIVEIDAGLDGVMEQFGDVEKHLSTVGDRAVQIGSRLKAVQTARTRAEGAKELIDFLVQFNAPGVEALSDVLTNPERAEEAAAILEQLLGIVDDLDAPGWETAVDQVKEYHGAMEADLLGAMRDAYDVGDAEVMKQCVDMLFTIKSGPTVVEKYVVDHPFFAPENAPTVDFEGDVATSLKKMYDGIRDVCESEHGVISRVFPNPSTVMRNFVKRIFDLQIRAFVDRALMLGAQQSRLEGLRMLDIVYGQTVQLARDLSKYELRDFSVKDETNALFVDPLANYMNNEKESLSEFTNQFVVLHTKVGKKEKSVFGGGSNEPFLAVSANARTILNAHGAAVARCQRLSSEMDASDNLQQLFVRLLNNLVKRFLGSVLLNVTPDLPPVESKTEPNVEVFLHVLSRINEIVYLLQDFFDEKIMSGVTSDAINVRAVCLEKKQEFLEALEEKTLEGVEQCLDATENWIQKLLVKHQKASDYLPKSSAVISDIRDTSSAACAEVVKFVEYVHDNVDRSLDRANADSVLTELSARLLDALMTHFKKFTYNEMGAVTLLQDIHRYQECVASFEIPEVVSGFQLLSEIGNLFLVAADNLRQVADDGKLDREVVRQFVSLRADFKEKKIARFFPPRGMGGGKPNP